MSHILEEYAKNLGVLISKPVVAQHYFPITENKYITIYLEDQIQSKNYKYYSLVFDLLRPILQEENIQIIQIDCKGKHLNNVNKVLSDLSFKQYANIISNSLLHIGIDNVYSHYASSIDIPLINLFGNVYPSISNGYWSKNDRKKDINPKWEVKPCLSIQDPKSEINTIKPEEIAQAILDILKFKKRINFKTIYIGDMFLHPIIEIIPTSFNPINIEEDQILFLRADYGFDEISFLQYCKNYKVAIISNGLIQPSVLEGIRQNIKKISIIVDEESGDIPERYFEILKIWGIGIQILIKEEKDLYYFKNKYFDQEVNLYENKSQKPENITENCLFFSRKRIIEGNDEYHSLAHWKIRKKIIDKEMNILDTPEYWQEQEHFYIYEQN